MKKKTEANPKELECSFAKIYGGTSYRCGVYGTIGLLVGDSSAGKSSLLTPIITAALLGTPFKGFSICVDGETILVNSEDSPIVLDEAKDKILKYTSTAQQSKFTLHNITEIDTPELKFKELEKIIEKAKPKSLIIVDILSDFISDINDVKGSNNIIAKLSSQVKSKDLILLVCNHTNNAGTSSGFVGKRFQNKATFGWKLELDSSIGVTLCSPIKRKLGFIPAFSFFIDDEGFYQETVFDPFPH